MSNLTLSEYSQKVGISEEALLGKTGKRSLSVARQIHWLYLKSVGVSYNRIAKMYGRRHPAILNGVKTVKNLIETKDVLIAPYLEFISSFVASAQTADTR